MLTFLFLPYSIASIDYLTDFQGFQRIIKNLQVFGEILRVSKDIKRFKMILRDFHDCSGILTDFKVFGGILRHFKRFFMIFKKFCGSLRDLKGVQIFSRNFVEFRRFSWKCIRFQDILTNFKRYLGTIFFLGF